MQGCHGNCSCGLYVCADYHGIMQIQPKGAILTSGKNHFHEMNGDVGMARWK